MRILVTGHKGYIGTVLVPMLLNRGFELVGLDSDLFSTCTFGEAMPDIPELRRMCVMSHPAISRGSTSSSIWRRCQNDPLGNLNPDFDV